MHAAIRTDSLFLNIIDLSGILPPPPHEFNTLAARLESTALLSCLWLQHSVPSWMRTRMHMSTSPLMFV